MKRLLIILVLTPILFSCQPKKEKPSFTPPPSREKFTEPQPDFFESGVQTELAEERTDWQNPEIVIRSLGDLKNKTVADIGAGAGYFSFKLAREAAKVIALDIDPNALEYIEEQKQIVGDWAKNIEPRLTPPDVPNLLPDEVDLILIVNTFFFIPNKENYFHRLLPNLKEDGELVIVDFKSGSIPVGPTDEMKISEKEVRSVLRKAGFRSISMDDNSLKYQYIVKAKR